MNVATESLIRMMLDAQETEGGSTIFTFKTTRAFGQPGKQIVLWFADGGSVLKYENPPRLKGYKQGDKDPHNQFDLNCTLDCCTRLNRSVGLTVLLKMVGNADENILMSIAVPRPY